MTERAFAAVCAYVGGFCIALMVGPPMPFFVALPFVVLTFMIASMFAAAIMHDERGPW